MTATQMIERMKDLPAPPRTGIQIMHLMQKPNCDVDEIIDVVRTDAVLSAKLLRICNSSGLGLQSPVSSVEQAVFYLGFAELRRLAVALSFGGAISRPLDGYGMNGQEFWMHSLLVAQGADALARNAAGPGLDPSVAYTGGLLHDIGKLVINDALTPELALEVRDRVEIDGCTRLDAERAVLGADHCEAGACLLQKWKLPPWLAEAVRDHHRPNFQPVPTLSVFVHLANCIAHQLHSEPGRDAGNIQMDTDAARSVGFTPVDLQIAVMAMQDQLEKVREFATAA